VWHRNAFIYGLHMGGPASRMLAVTVALGRLVISVRSVRRVDANGPKPDQQASLEPTDIAIGT
jgi:hypothetical protein